MRRRSSRWWLPWGAVYVTRADRAGALRIAEEDVRLVERVRDPALAIQLHTQLGTIHTFCAEYARARAHQTQVLTLYTTAEHESSIFSSGVDPLMIMYLLSSLGLWLAGWLDQSKQQQHNLLARAAQLHGRILQRLCWYPPQRSWRCCGATLTRPANSLTRAPVSQWSMVLRCTARWECLCKGVSPCEAETSKQGSIC